MSLLSARVCFAVTVLLGLFVFISSRAECAPPAQLTYGFERGKVYHYKVVALFSGQIPKLSDPGNDVHIKAELYYSATVQKQDVKGTTLVFSVEAEDLSFLQKEPGPDGKIAPDDELPFPLPLAQIQSYLNVTALLRPDGSIAEVTGGSNDPIKIDVGVDLRKLFVLMLPIVFPNHAISVGGNWNFDEGFLGKKAGQTSYTGKLESIHDEAGRTVFKVSQSASSTVNSFIDKEGNSTQDPKLQAGSITGDVSASGSMDFGASKPKSPGVSAADNLYTGRLITGSMKLNVALTRKMPDPDHPGKTLVDPITVRGRMMVSLQPGPPKTEAAQPHPASITSVAQDKDK